MICMVCDKKGQGSPDKGCLYKYIWLIVKILSCTTETDMSYTVHFYYQGIFKVSNKLKAPVYNVSYMCIMLAYHHNKIRGAQPPEVIFSEVFWTRRGCSESFLKGRSWGIIFGRGNFHSQWFSSLD